MSGRRRRDDEWDDGRLDAQDDRRDPWADDSIGDWGSREADPGDDADRSSASSGGGAYSSGGAAGAYVRNAPPGGKAYAAPAFPSFQMGSGAGNGSSSGGGYGSSGYGDDRYGAGSGQRGASNGHAAGGYNGDGPRDAGYGAGRDTYQGAGYGRSSGGNGGYDRSGYGAGGQGSDSCYSGGAGYAGANGRSGSTGHSPEFMPVDNDDVDDEAPAGTPRPYGRLSIYTLHDDKTREFDRLAERAAEGVRTSEPDTLVYVIHVVPKAPMQRIIYEIYRDRGAFLSHERQPHIRQFAADRAPCVLATNIIDLRLKYAKVAALGSAPEAAAQPQASWTPRAAEAAPGNDRYAATAQYSPAQYSPSPQYSPAQYSSSPQYSPAQYSPAQNSPAEPQASGAAASFTPAADRHGADNSQYPTVGREAYSPATQYGNSGNGAFGAGNGQYGAANSNGYSGAAGYANGGSYSSNGYPSPNGYQGASGYSGDNSYASANGYQSGNGYSGANGYPDGSGYSNGSGYSGTNGYPDGSGYSSGAGNAGGNGYGAPSGYGENGENGAGSSGAPATVQYTPRYRELTSGAQSDADAGGHPDSGNRYADGGRQSARPQSSEWPPRSQDYQ
jgi:quinol monooxygenase YgiN